MSFEFSQNESIFIAGSSGMVGSAIKREFLNLKIDNEPFKGEILCPTRKELDLTNFIEVEKWFKINKPSIVIIAAAKVGGIIANSEYPYEFILENLKIQTNLIEISWEYKVKKLLFLGSSCIYPKFSPQPIKEEYLLTNTLEETNEFYALAKIAGIKLCQSLMIQHKFNSICLMPTNLYGPGDNYHINNSHVIPSLIRKFNEAKINKLDSVICWGTGNPLREFLYVDDLAKACIFLLKNWNPIYENNYQKENYNSWINVGSKDEVSIKELSKKISNACGFEGEIIWDTNKPDGTPRKKLDTSKINRLGWQAKINLDEGIKLTLEAYKKEMKKNILRV